MEFAGKIVFNRQLAIGNRQKSPNLEAFYLWVALLGNNMQLATGNWQLAPHWFEATLNLLVLSVGYH